MLALVKTRFYFLQGKLKQGDTPMPNTPTSIHGTQVLICSPDGEKLQSERDALDLIGEAMHEGASLIVVPVERLTADFFELKTRLAGHIVQKFVTYRLRLVILGDISAYMAQSRSLKSFVYEANQGSQLWFLPDLQALNE